MFLRGSDLKSLYKEKNMKGCLINSNQIKEMDICFKKVRSELSDLGIYNNLKIILLDYHQLFYILIICIAHFSIMKYVL